MKRLLLFTLLLLFPLSVPASAEEVITAESRITAVTVYPDRAQVTREASIRLDKGTSKVLFPGLPPTLMEDSVRVKGRGAARLGTVETKKTYLETVPAEEVKRLQDELQSLQDEDGRLSDDLAIAGKQKEFYQAIQFHDAEIWSREITIGKVSVDEWGKVVDFLARGQEGAAARARAAEVRRRELKDRMDFIKRKLAEVQSRGAKERYYASIEVSSASPGELELELGYVVPGPSWGPLYEARAFPDAGEVELTYLGQVSQGTSEDWKGVRLSLSTAKPAVGGSPPQMYPWYVGIFEPVPVYRGKAKDEGMRMMEAPAAAPPAPREAEAMTADVRAAGPSVLFEIPSPQDVPADGSLHKVTVSREKLKAEFTYFTVPSLSPFVYLNAKVTNTANYPFLAGPLSVFLGQDFIGKSMMPLTAPGAPVELSLGIDEGLTVKREVSRFEEDKGLIGKSRRITFKCRITVESFKDKPHTVVVQDRVPVSSQEEVVVKLVKADPQPSERRGDGIMKWRLEAGPREKKEIYLEYYIEFPRDKRVSGI